MRHKVYKIITQELTKEIHYIRAEDKQEALEIYDDTKDTASPSKIISLFTGLVDIQEIPENLFDHNKYKEPSKSLMNRARRTMSKNLTEDEQEYRELMRECADDAKDRNDAEMFKAWKENFPEQYNQWVKDGKPVLNLEVYPPMEIKRRKGGRNGQV